MLSPKIITKTKVIGGLLSFAILVIVALDLFVSHKTSQDSFMINIAGKQSMLSQKISKDLYYINLSDSFDFSDIDVGVDEFVFNLNALKNGDEKLGIYAPPTQMISEKLDSVEEVWLKFYENMKQVKHHIKIIKKDKEIFTERVKELLNISDKVVQKMLEVGLSNEYINTSGKQRMLSQKMAFYFSRYLRSDNEKDLFLFSSAKSAYTENLKIFMNDIDVQKHDKLYVVLQQKDLKWKNFLLFLETLLEKERAVDKNVQYIYENNLKLLDTMDEAVWLYTDYSRAKIEFLKNFQYMFAVIALLIMIYSMFSIRELDAHMNLFVNKAKDLASLEVGENDNMYFDYHCAQELEVAGEHINTFVNKVNSAVSKSTDAIKQAELAITEMQMIQNEIEHASSSIDKKIKSDIDKELDNSEYMAIESTENLLHVSKLLQKLQKSMKKIESLEKKS